MKLLFQATGLSNCSARHSFIFLLVSIALLCAAAVSIAGIFLLYGRHPVSTERLVDDAYKAITIAQSLPKDQLQKIRVFDTHGIHVTVSARPNPHAQTLMAPSQAQVAEYINAHSYNFRMAIPLVGGQWANVHGMRPHSNWVNWATVVLTGMLMLSWVFVALWPIKQLAWPWEVLTRAVRRFGLDVDAPPLAEAGSRELQTVIRAFNEMQSRIRRLLRDRTQMLAAISHDLRTPITRLKLRAEYLLGTEQYVKMIADLNEMEHMIASILAFAREQNSTEVAERFDINALLESICDELLTVGQGVTYQGPEGVRVAYVGRIMALKRALANLIENAVKYGRQAQVTLYCDQLEQLQVMIEDEGPGIAETEMENVFAPFYRLDASRSLQQSGTGLGMALARDIIRAHGGEITLFNRPQGGLRVVVTLPHRQ